jgi:hypothetical protein
MLRHLYGLPLFAASEDGEEDGVIDVWTWHELCIVALRLGISALPKQALEQLEVHFEKKMSIDEKTGLLHDKASIAWFVQNVQLIQRCISTNRRTDVVDMILKFACRHFTELEKSGEFKALTDTLPNLYRDMLRYGAQHF